MAEYIVQDKTMQDIADAVREKTEKTEPLTPSQMAAEIRGIEKGGAPAGWEYANRFENTFQYTKIDSVDYTFDLSKAGAKADRPIFIKSLFAQSEFSDPASARLKVILPNAVKSAITLNSSFTLPALKQIELILNPEIPTINYMGQAFGYCKSLEVIGGTPIIAEDNCPFYNAFKECANLREIRFSYGQNGFFPKDLSFQDCVSLSPESVQSVIDALRPLKAPETNKITFSKSLKNPLTESQKQQVINKGWQLIFA